MCHNPTKLLRTLFTNCLVTVLIAIILFFCMYDVSCSRIRVFQNLPDVRVLQYPENATFLTDAERAWLLETLKLDSAAGSKKFKRKFIVQAIRDPKSYLFASLFFL